MRIQSFTNPDVFYEVDADKRTCSCMAFTKKPKQPCKHLLSTSELFPQPATLNVSEAMSAFIKSIRLRRTDDAIVWLRYLWYQQGLKSRLQRRILVCAGEDNISVNVTEAVSQWFGSSLNKRSLELAAIEVARICATDNWYAQPDGRFYIFGWEKAEFEPKQGLPKTYPELLTFFSDAIAECRDVEAMKSFNSILSNRSFRPRDFAALLLDLAKDSTSQQARHLIDIYVRNASALWLDGNISGQAVFALLNGDFGYQTAPIVDAVHVMKLLADAERRITDGLVIPDYARDGIHTRQSGDRRFAGTVKQMAGCCRAYEHYGRLDPSDEWVAQFYQSDNS